jgi:hypothetical protein
MAFKSEKMFFTEKINSVLVSDLKEPFEKCIENKLIPRTVFPKNPVPRKETVYCRFFSGAL